MEDIDRPKAVTQHFLGKSFRKSKVKKIIEKSEKHKEVFFSECLLRFGVHVILCCPVCLFLYGPLCHGALKLDMSTLFTTSFL